MRSPIVLVVSCLLAGFVACSDDDGSNVVPNGPPGAGGGGAGGVPSAGASGTSGSSGRAGAGGGAGSPSGGSGGVAGCSPVAPDAGSDAGPSDAGSLDAGADGGGLDASTAGGVVSFAEDIHPIFEAACTPCHTVANYAGHNVGGELEQAYADAVRLGVTLVQRIDGGGMPPSDAAPPYNCPDGGQPGDEGCLTVAQVALVQTWINQCYPR